LGKIIRTFFGFIQTFQPQDLYQCFISSKLLDDATLEIKCNKPTI